ncbi:hypothetical protein SOCE26_061460 [Sorangium cellulosum]|uniref:Uncharacterized protein n=1 Tax=Sorangium cellulosum TaxID=56 RepID=A0A2L0EZL3_SORCE|nr:hypothetical protein [Sorangium cellulosum]AUX44679.1 hypothetical protein SOCE26_061460 [Sorangium cellulosum]
MNPYAPPTAPTEHRPAPGEPISPERHAEIQRQLKRLNTMSFAFGLPGLVLQSIGRTTDNVLLALGGAVLFVIALVNYAKMRGRNGALGLLGLFTCVGLAILYFLPKLCLNCQAKHPYRARQCERCSAPLGS